MEFLTGVEEQTFRFQVCDIQQGSSVLQPEGCRVGVTGFHVFETGFKFTVRARARKYEEVEPCTQENAQTSVATDTVTAIRFASDSFQTLPEEFRSIAFAQARNRTTLIISDVH
jgi:hypothetical protein